MKCVDALSKIDAYICNRLSHRELEEFLEHIKQCKECYEELEIHYIISIGMKYLEQENPGSYDILKMLKEDLKEKEKMVKRRKIILAGLFLLIVLAGAGLLLSILMFLGQAQPFSLLFIQ